MDFLAFLKGTRGALKILVLDLQLPIQPTGPLQERLQAVQSLIPAALRPAVKAGPLEGTQWCLLVQGNAAAAKLRQLLPMLTARLREQGWAVETIRLKVQA